AGTDPKEGGALAEAIILYAIKNQAKLVATTHYSQLKTLATEYAEIENASLEFDRKTLAPTYRLHLGIPGSSYAVEIAGRLGLPKDICQRASTLIGGDEKSLDVLIGNLETELARVKQDGAELSERLARAKQLEELYTAQSERLRADIEGEKKKALAETQEFLDQTRRDIEKLVAEIRKSQADKKAVKQFHRNLQQRQRRLEKLQHLEQTEPEHYTFEAGDAVEILTLNQRGEIEELLGHDRARVKVGSMLTTVELRNLRKIAPETRRKPPQRTASFTVEEVERPEIHLRGMTVEEAMEALEKFLDRAVLAGFSQVYIVHGKGTGALRRTLTDYLKNHPDVESLRLGNWNEGGAGVTIARLKE
ncbi:MAG: Smr/MutS family protein, partial [Candidatus Zixiibacteriota bacterium]